MDRLLYYLFAGSRGGPTRIRIMRELLAEPRNLHQLAKTLALDYKTVEYQIRVLRKHVLVTVEDPKVYGAVYFPSKNFLASLPTFEELAARSTRAAAKEARQGAPQEPPEPAQTWEKQEIDSKPDGD